MRNTACAIEAVCLHRRGRKQRGCENIVDGFLQTGITWYVLDDQLGESLLYKASCGLPPSSKTVEYMF
eukprot:4607799-Amphidinium_carterae.1